MKLLLLSRRTFKNLDNINNTDFSYIAMLKWKLEFFTYPEIFRNREVLSLPELSLKLEHLN